MKLLIKILALILLPILLLFGWRPKDYSKEWSEGDKEKLKITL